MKRGTTTLSCTLDRPLYFSSSKLISDGFSSSSSSSSSDGGACRRAAARTVDESVGFEPSSEIVVCFVCCDLKKANQNLILSLVFLN